MIEKPELIQPCVFLLLVLDARSFYISPDHEDRAASGPEMHDMIVSLST
jgi:hypothetical protein